MVCAGWRVVQYSKCFDKQDKVLSCCRSPPSRDSFSDLGPDPCSSGRRSLWSSQGAFYNALYPECLLAFQGFGLSSSLWRSEALASNEQDVGPPSRWLQAGLHPPRTVFSMSSNQCLHSSSPREGIALKADELYQSWVSSSSVNLLSKVLEDSLQVNAVSSGACPPKAPLSQRSSTPATFYRFPTSPGTCWFQKKHGDKAVNCRKPCFMSEN